MNTLPKYETYKDSGIEWLGEIPAHWGFKALKHIASLRSGETIKPDDFSEDGYPVYGGNGFRGYTPTYTNDGSYILIGRQGALCGNVNYASGKFYASEHAIVVYPKSKIETLWLGETIRVADFNRFSQSAAQPGIAVAIIKDVYLPFPPLEEQTAIAHFLDQKTAQIDAAIAIKEQQIALLKERKQILIQQAVTQGLDPTVPMKDSGVEWIGEIPAHWECLKLKLACKFIYDGTHGSYPRVEEGYRLLSVRNIINDAFFFREDDSRVSFKHFKEISSKFLIQEDDIQLAIVGATLGKVAIIKKIEEEFVTQRSLSTIRVNSRCNNEFLAYFMRSPAFQAYLWNNAGFSAQPGVYLNTVQNCYMPLPSIDEQKEIINFIRSSFLKIDDALSLQQQQIEKLREYKTTLINSAVTGKIRVTPEMVAASA